MENLLDSFSKVEYLTIFGTFIFGYVATQFFFGWGSMIGYRKQLTFSIEHLVWTFVTFILLIDVWWGSWLKGKTISAHRLYFYLSLLSPIIFYILSIIQFPALEKVTNHNLKDYFERIRRNNYIIFLILLLSFYLNDFFLQDDSPPSDYYYNTAAFALAMTGLVVNKRWLDKAIISIGACLLILHMVTQKSFNDSQNTIQNFTVTEYLTIFTAFIYGAVATKFFAGWGLLVYNTKNLRYNKEYLLWTFLAFALLMDLWWGQWDREPYISKDIGRFVLALITPVACYLQSVIMFPVIKREDEVDLNQFYQRNKTTIILLFGIILGTNFIVANIMEENNLWSSVNILRLSSVILVGVGLYFNNTNLHRVLLFLGWAMIIFHAFDPGN